jgi:hypothetical protein
MGLQRRNLERVERTIPVTYGDETFDVTYRPGVISANDIDDISHEVGEDNPHHAIAVSLARVLVWWDVQDGDDDVKPTADNLMGFPLTLLRTVQHAIAVDCEPGGKGSSSAGGGRRAR